MSKLTVALFALITPSLALAHSGHGHVDTASIWHWLLEFDHIGWIVPAAIVLMLVIRSRSADSNS
ncbi:hypothetical protein F3F96_06155 [Mariprofundus sp. NF]|uniref:hypothetical protein n=1 Tax=Mariprofundus sp. NF TaxID=2608716 RepID=UPI0015A035BD|nr:hypothetical protein [Mariprofundus sp. NF]NWF38713.1 hypothetical protein [Mariprofundus sp. NF]